MRDRAGGSVLRALTRPPAHRGPLIAAGAVVLTVGVALEELRLAREIGPAAHLLILAVVTAAILGLGLQAHAEEDRPPAYQSVLLVTGLLLLAGTLLRLADVLGADFTEGDAPTGAFVWTSLVLAGVAAWISMTRRSAVALLIAALAVGVALVTALEWIFDADSQGPYRVLLLVLAVGARPRLARAARQRAAARGAARQRRGRGDPRDPADGPDGGGEHAAVAVRRRARQPAAERVGARRARRRVRPDRLRRGRPRAGRGVPRPGEPAGVRGGGGRRPPTRRCSGGRCC